MKFRGLSLRYKDLQLLLLRLMKPYWDRVVAFDIETYVREGEFLTNERILAISYARRVKGDFLSPEGIETETLFLEDDSDKAEIELLLKFAERLSKIKSLCVIGYGIRSYDVPLLAIKKQHYGERIRSQPELSRLYWKIVDFVEAELHIDLYHVLKKKFSEVVYAEEFKELPLKRSKRIVTEDRTKKSEEIYRLWREDRERLREYVEGDVHDALLIAEELLLKAERRFSSHNQQV